MKTCDDCKFNGGIKRFRERGALMVRCNLWHKHFILAESKEKEHWNKACSRWSNVDSSLIRASSSV